MIFHSYVSLPEGTSEAQTTDHRFVSLTGAPFFATQRRWTFFFRDSQHLEDRLEQGRQDEKNHAQQWFTGWWFGTCFFLKINFHILGIKIPFDLRIFQRD